ncbi:copper resistance protein CopD [Campylobacter rectus]|uniref:copper resistance protein CopD n=1 Tax=Campylobacter rectus TaxID=203 RepID=UPI0023F0C719|nr:copper resistance protein CopD [Campylobacter rectus]
MQAIYPYAQLIHLICAIIFVGFLFFDVIIFSRAKKKLPADIAQKAQQAITSIAIKIMPLCVSPLALTGGMMAGGRVGSKAGGHFSSNLQIAFMIKLFAAFIALAAVVANLTRKFALARQATFTVHLHRPPSSRYVLK